MVMNWYDTLWVIIIAGMVLLSAIITGAWFFGGGRDLNKDK